MKRTISVILLVIILTISTITPIYAQDFNSNNQGTVYIELTEEAKDLSDDTIILHLDDGTPIRKGDISEDGDISYELKSKVFENIGKLEEDSGKVKAFNLDSNNKIGLDAQLRPGRKSALVIKELYSQGFRQTTRDLYCSVGKGRQVARRFDGPSGVSTVVSGLVSIFSYKINHPFIAFGSLIYSLTSAINGYKRGRIARDIRSYTDKNKKVLVRLIKTSYGTLNAVRYWDGFNVDTSTINNKYTKEKLVLYETYAH